MRTHSQGIGCGSFGGAVILTDYRDLSPTDEGRYIGTGLTVHLEQNQKTQWKDASDAEGSDVSLGGGGTVTLRPQWA